MHNCNCVVNYQAQKEEYVTTVNMIKNGFNSLDMLWDTGAGNTVIYLNLLRKVKGINEYDLRKLEALLNFNDENKIGYRFKLFGSALTEKSIGILCCANNVYVNHLRLDNFYFFVLPADKNKTRGLLGADFISCCERNCSIGMNEIFSRFDEDLYEQKFKMSGFIQNEQESAYNLNLLTVHEVEVPQKSNDLNKAKGVNAFLE